MQRTKQQHEERQEALLNPAPREELLKERTRVEENIARLRKETDNLKEQTIRAESCGSELSVREQKLWQDENVEVPRLRHAISLYANISSWCLPGRKRYGARGRGSPGGSQSLVSKCCSDEPHAEASM